MIRFSNSLNGGNPYLSTRSKPKEGKEYANGFVAEVTDNLKIIDLATNKPLKLEPNQVKNLQVVSGELKVVVTGQFTFNQNQGQPPAQSQAQAPAQGQPAPNASDKKDDKKNGKNGKKEGQPGY